MELVMMYTVFFLPGIKVVRIKFKSIDLVVGCGIAWGINAEAIQDVGNAENRLLPGRVFNLPGRGVLRFSWPGYRNPVHFLAIFAKNDKNSSD